MPKLIRILSGISVLVLSMLACTGVTSTPVPAVQLPILLPTEAAVVTPEINIPPLTVDILKNAQYQSPDWGIYQLTDGVFFRPPAAPGESAEVNQTQLGDMFAFGDLNADGADDAVDFLYTQSGGTGHFVEMAAMLNQNGSAVNVSTLYLGDREVIRSIQISQGIILLDILTHGPNDPLCCASQMENRQYRLDNNQLTRIQ